MTEQKDSAAAITVTEKILTIPVTPFTEHTDVDQARAYLEECEAEIEMMREAIENQRAFLDGAVAKRDRAIKHYNKLLAEWIKDQGYRRPERLNEVQETSMSTKPEYEVYDESVPFGPEQMAAARKIFKTKLSNDTNRIIAEWLGKCWHESDNPDDATVECRKCNYSFGGGAWESEFKRMAYTESLDLVSVVEKKAVEVFGRETYAVAVCRTIKCTIPHAYVELMPFITASAEVRASAIRKLIEEKL